MEIVNQQWLAIKGELPPRRFSAGGDLWLPGRDPPSPGGLRRGPSWDRPPLARRAPHERAQGRERVIRMTLLWLKFSPGARSSSAFAVSLAVRGAFRQGPPRPGTVPGSDGGRGLP